MRTNLAPAWRFRSAPYRMAAGPVEFGDAASLFDELKANGADVSELEDKPRGQREFGVLTPDGHRFMFSQQLAQDACERRR